MRSAQSDPTSSNAEDRAPGRRVLMQADKMAVPQQMLPMSAPGPLPLQQMVPHHMVPPRPTFVGYNVPPVHHHGQLLYDHLSAAPMHPPPPYLGGGYPLGLAGDTSDPCLGYQTGYTLPGQPQPLLGRALVVPPDVPGMYESATRLSHLPPFHAPVCRSEPSATSRVMVRNVTREFLRSSGQEHHPLVRVQCGCVVQYRTLLRNR
uniref:Uncharacterized protein n=1 Tax=Rhizochromulina marina TaxID=1034831 RepID=A0A7S2SEM7_9STRA|mmetsp:Transcript_29073/g.84897  ORF Transcript_29073/g.84897 Transcript_29073/m.84897 type:complete len:205 (+) Transcript_29073:368-982(+)